MYSYHTHCVLRGIPDYMDGWEMRSEGGGDGWGGKRGWGPSLWGSLALWWIPEELDRKQPVASPQICPILLRTKCIRVQFSKSTCPLLEYFPLLLLYHGRLNIGPLLSCSYEITAVDGMVLQVQVTEEDLTANTFFSTRYLVVTGLWLLLGLAKLNSI